MDRRLGLVIILMLMHIVQARVIRDKKKNLESPDIDKNLLKLFLTRSRKFEVENGSLGFSIKIKSKNFNKFIENGKKQDEFKTEAKLTTPENSFSRITK